MITIHSFTFNPFQENTYILFDETKECIIIDPGCYSNLERKELADYISQNNLKPVRLLNTHCHLDHVFGNGFVADKYNLKLEININEQPVLDSYLTVASIYNLNAEPSPVPSVFLNEGNLIEFGKSKLEILFTPGHSPGSITFYDQEQEFMISGDVLFYQSVGRSDLPGGDLDTLMDSIKTKLFSFNNDYKVYGGHGPATTIGFERATNPFLI